MTLAALIARLESATVGSRELDEAIDDYLGNIPALGGYYGWERLAGLPAAFCKPLNSDATQLETYSCPHFTTSIDAALTLLASDRLWSIGTIIKKAGYVVVLDNDGKSYRGPTPALALCIAALNARL